MRDLPLLYVRAITGFNRRIAEASALLVYLIVPIILFEVVSRYAFDAPTVWSMELAALLFGPYFMLAGPWLLAARGHVAVDFMRNRLSPRAGHALDLAVMPVIFGFAGLLLLYSWPFAMNAFAMKETSFSSWNPQIWPFKFAIPLAASLLLAQALAETIKTVYGLLGREVQA